jgi:hypothetical protein
MGAFWRGMFAQRRHAQDAAAVHESREALEQFHLDYVYLADHCHETGADLEATWQTAVRDDRAAILLGKRYIKRETPNE